MELELVSIGDAVGVILPQDILTRLNLQLGDTLFVSNTPDGFQAWNRDPEFEAQLALARRIMRDRAGVLRELAKHD